MALPTPQLGLVISYAYLWHREHEAGRDEGAKDRPCVIVLAVENQDDGTTIVTVVPVTHVPPTDPAHAVELPQAVKRQLGLDADRSWVVLTEGNEFAWPGFDLRPVPGSRDRYDYGFIPPKLFRQIVERIASLWAKGPRLIAGRD